MKMDLRFALQLTYAAEDDSVALDKLEVGGLSDSLFDF